MTTIVEIIEERDIQRVIREIVLVEPMLAQNLVESFLYFRYKITLEQFDKVIKATIPEDVI